MDFKVKLSFSYELQCQISAGIPFWIKIGYPAKACLIVVLFLFFFIFHFFKLKFKKI